MILFCEECGVRNDLQESEATLLAKGFVCSTCGSLTPPSLLAVLFGKQPVQRVQGRGLVKGSGDGLHFVPDVIALGDIPAGRFHRETIALCNSTEHPVRLHLTPVVADYSLAIRFLLDGDKALHLLPGQRGTLQLQLWATPEISAAWPFCQYIKVAGTEVSQHRSKLMAVQGMVRLPQDV